MSISRQTVSRVTPEVSVSYEIEKKQMMTHQEQGFESLLQNNDELNSVKNQLDNVILDLDRKLNNQLKKQEHDYLQGYSIYIKSKERELKNLIQKLNSKNSNNTVKDETIYKLNQKLENLNQERLDLDKHN